MMATALMIHRVVKMENKFRVQWGGPTNWSFVTRGEVLPVDDNWGDVHEWNTALEARQWVVNKINALDHYEPRYLEVVMEVFALAK